MKTNRQECPFKDYVTPRVVSIDIENEGVLCSSTEDLIIDEDWGDLM